MTTEHTIGQIKPITFRLSWVRDVAGNLLMWESPRAKSKLAAQAFHSGKWFIYALSPGDRNDRVVLFGEVDAFEGVPTHGLSEGLSLLNVAKAHVENIFREYYNK